MNADDFVFNHAKAAVLAKGYDEFDATECANHALIMYRRNQLKNASQFVEAALNHAKKHFQPKPI